MEILDSSEIGSDNASNLTKTMKNYLTETAKWGKFLAIVGFVGIGLIIIAAFSVGFIFEKLGESSMGQFGFNPGAAFTFIYLLMALLWFFPVLYLFNFSTGILKSIPTMDVFGIEKALSNLKSLFKFYAIFTLIILGIYALVFLFAIIGGLASL